MTETLWSDAISFPEALTQAGQLTDVALDRLLVTPPGLEARVYEAMRYAALAPGKRMRPFLVLASGRLFGVAQRCALQVATAIEMVHAYSMVHDDLPAMDNSDLRRGRPTCHKEFDEATAVLAGDGLLTTAFGVLADPDTHGDPAVRCELVAALAGAAGAAGMVGGQMIDLIAEHQSLDIGEITRLQRMKTGALIAFRARPGRFSPRRRMSCAPRCAATLTIWGWPTRSPTICSTSRVPPRSSGSRSAPTLPPASLPSCRSSA